MGTLEYLTGPGCSSLGYGAMEELGPFQVLSDGKTLIENVFSWKYAANVLFLESPASVGFSYSNTKSDINIIGDKETAKDNYAFLVNWLERFPEYKKRDFYIAGESYAGHYVPQLAQTILHQNKANKTNINLKGIIIGNAVINDDTDIEGMWRFYGSHALISDDVASEGLKYCVFNLNETKQCDDAVNKSGVGNINLYNIYAPLCSNNNLTNKPNKIQVSNDAHDTSPDPCIDNYVYAYLNRPDVQKALHVTNIPYKWNFCSHEVSDKWTDSPYTISPLIKEVMANGLRVWIYSGDVDAVIPVTSTQLSIKNMKPHIITGWLPWIIDGEEK
ncbi:hypothetical protein CASFOL_000461 [Castilleja foliolosa]|uniref:Carboxypeptidase n=1 Tax=Castilleja foliolosa TaxID=1961234 RepID=A0ABD3EST0_9LAMI